MEVDDSGRWNIADNTYNGNTWNRQSISLYLYFVQLRDHQENTDLSDNICEKWPSIPVFGVIYIVYFI